MTTLLIACAGGFGVVMRFLIDSVMSKDKFPTGTFTINLIGSAILGFFTGMYLGSGISQSTLAILGTGFAGGFTTFSTASLETYTMLKDNQAKKAHLYAWSMLILCLITAYISILLGFTLTK
ncbi:CrcB protein [Arcanobacterium pluranimalium]|uniref:fluoride efflux transporter CrcB n=1 Tax=Arcanobacterium pluranimalium TaxID=108028 RepID=UPI00195A233D|nr:fluoride efflux transporter CrcB [Arcanobacterium pluranimalium]MBM7825553.1 CrcB protein [Arcanobacterium pluranimalium]